MSWSRRQLLRAGSALAMSLALPALRPGIDAYIDSLLRAQFGEPIASHGATRRFVRDAADAVRKWLGLPTAVLVESLHGARLHTLPPIAARLETLDEFVLQQFVTSTNVLETLSRATELRYAALFDAYTSPCGNHLGALYDFEAAG